MEYVEYKKLLDQAILDDRAVKAIAEKKRLPEGIRLIQCIWRRRDVGNE